MLLKLTNGPCSGCLVYVWCLVTFVSLVTMCRGGIVPDAQKTVEEIHQRVKRQAAVRCNIADIVFVLDSSGSIGLDNWALVLNFTKSVALGFDIGSENVQFGVNYYGNKAQIAFNLNTYNNTNAVLQAIDQIPWLNENTNTSGGIRLMHRDMFTTASGARPNVPKIGIVITDGESTFDQTLTIPEAITARNKGIKMFAIGITSAVNQAELIGIASSPQQDFVFNAEDFAVLDSIRQQVVTAACQAASDCTVNPDLVFLLDASGSIRRTEFERMLTFLENVVLETNVDNQLARIGLLKFSTTPQVIFQLNTHNTRQAMINDIRALQYEGGTTNVAESIRVAREQMFQIGNGDRPDVHNVLVLLSDGGSNNLASVLQQAALTRLADITILVAAVGNWVDINELNEIASDPDGVTVIAAPFTQLGSIANQLKRGVCDDVDECLAVTTPCQNGGTCIDLIGRYSCVCPQGFAGPRCQYVCTPDVDIVLLLDASSSMGESEWFAVLGYAKELVRNFNVDSGQMRVAVATYANGVTIRFNLNDYFNMTDIINVMSWPFESGTTNTAEALRVMHASMLTTGNGDRPGVRDIVIVLTDGHSSNRVETFRQAANVHSDGITVLGVGVTVRSQESRLEMQGITSDPDSSNYIEVAQVSDLYGITSRLIGLVCNDINNCSESPCQNGGTCVDRLNRYECQCPIGFTGINCERACDGAFDIGILIDTSGSIRANRFPAVIDFIQNVTNQLEVRPGRTHIGVITFSDSAVMRFSLTQYSTKEDVLHAMERIPFTRGQTNTADAISMGRQQLFTTANGDRNTVPNILLIFTDGQSTVQKSQTIPQAIQTRIQGVHIIVVAVESDPTNLELKGMASDPDNANMFTVARYGEIPSLVQTLVSSTCNNVNECAGSPCVNSGTCVDGFGQYVCRCTSEFTGRNCERACTAQRDIVFIIDATQSMTLAFSTAQELVKTIVYGLNFANSWTRVAVITYQTTYQIQFHLNKYTLKQEVLNAIAFVNDPTLQGTNTATALQAMRNEVFVTANGDRSGIQNVAITITDGRSNLNPGGTISEAQQAKNAGVRMITVGIGSGPNMGELNGIASDPQSSNVFIMQEVSAMQSTADNVLNQICP